MKDNVFVHIIESDDKDLNAMKFSVGKKHIDIIQGVKQGGLS